MSNLFKIVYLILFLILSFSCVENKSSEKEIRKSKFINSSKNTLRFTSGVCSVFQDHKGNYWFGSHKEGVCCFDGKSLEYFTTNEGLSSNQVRSIQEDKSGNIWFGTSNGVSSYDGQKITNHTLGLSINLPSKWIKTDNDLWFNAGNNAGVYRYDGQKLNYLAFPKSKIINPDNTYHTTSLAKGKNNMLWIATYSGVFGYNGNQFTIINDETLGLEKETGELHIRSIFEDSKGRLWIGNNGIGVLLKDNGTIINFSEKNSLIHPTSLRSGDKSQAGTLEHVFVIREDSDGNIWFGDRDTGTWKYDGKTMTNYIIDKKLKSQMVWDIYEDQTKNLLFAMAEGGVYQFNGKSFDKQF